MLRLWQRFLALGVERAARNAGSAVVQNGESLRLAEELARRLEEQQRSAA
jgi:hypothetical protein